MLFRSSAQREAVHVSSFQDAARCLGWVEPAPLSRSEGDGERRASVGATWGETGGTASGGFDLFSALGAGVGAYQGYTQAGTIGWAIGGAVLGSIFPLLTIAVVAAMHVKDLKAT